MEIRPDIDLAILNAKVWTENPSQPQAEAIAVCGSRIFAVGSSSEIQSMTSDNTRVIDAQGRRVLPGFNDAHVHFYMGGDTLTSVNLRQARSKHEFRDIIGQFAPTQPKGEWILHGSWDHENWEPAELPVHGLIDDVTANHPVWVNRSDGHMTLANSLAMNLAGINRNTPNVPGGQIVRDSSGNPTGIFKDAAKKLVERLIPLPSRARIESALIAAQNHAVENGVTSVQDMGVLGTCGGATQIEALRTYQAMEERGDLKVRVSAHIPLPEWRRLADAGIRAHFGSEKLKIGAVKSFSDGSLGSTTAWFFEPYSDAPESFGLPSDELMDPDLMYENLKQADRAGLQVAIHAIGDRANATVLDFWERLSRENGVRDRRARIEHAQHLRDIDILRFRPLNVIASVQPYHCIDDGRWACRRIGSERAKRTYAFRSLLDAGAVLAFGSDWWVAPISPLMGIFAAVSRQTLDGAYPDGWIPEQKVSVSEAIHAYTVASAYASGEDQIKGSVEPGKLADLVILSDDILTTAPENIQHARVDATIFDGKVVYDRSLR